MIIGFHILNCYIFPYHYEMSLLVILLFLKAILSDISILISVCFLMLTVCMVYLFSTFNLSSTFKSSVSLYLRSILCSSTYLGLVFIPICPSPPFNWNIYSPFTFNIIFVMVGFNLPYCYLSSICPICFFVCFVFVVPLLSFSCLYLGDSTF